MAKGSSSIKLSTNFMLLAKSMLDERQYFDTLAEMRGFSPLHVADGLITYCKETNKHYYFNGTEWNELAQGTDGVVKFKGVQATKSDLLNISDMVEGDMAIVEADETSDNRRTAYIYTNGAWNQLIEIPAVENRDFTKNPIDLSTEVTGVLPQDKVDLSGLKLPDVDVSDKMDKSVYDKDNDGIVDVAKSLEGLTVSVTEINSAIQNAHTHDNINILGQLSENAQGNLTYKGQEIAGSFDPSSIDLSGKMDIDTYDNDGDGIVDVAKGVSGIESASQNMYYGTDSNGDIGFHNITKAQLDIEITESDIEQMVGDMWK